MNKEISILGCGWLGFSLAKALTKLGYQVKGSTTTINKLEQLKEIGIASYLFDISNQKNKDLAFLSSAIISSIFFLATAAANSLNGDDFASPPLLDGQ